ncbi:MAG: helix-turn-helix transcriptional regulator [Clostridia bacterium]|nr:helix-turn-helix transcriptional regulator [Clostridia bacterium]
MYDSKLSPDINHDTVFRVNGIMTHQLIFTASGKGLATFGNTDSDVMHDTVMYHSPNSPHIYRSSQEGWQYYWLTYTQNETFDFLDLKTGTYTISDTDFFISLCTEIINMKHDVNFGINSSAILYRLLLYLEKSISNPVRFAPSTSLSPAIDYINMNYNKPIELKILSDLCYITPEHFCRKFMSIYGMRPLEYVQSLRIQDAKTKLPILQNMSIEEIGRSVGYENTSYFIKIFKKIVGVTPHTYRNEHIELK